MAITSCDLAELGGRRWAVLSVAVAAVVLLVGCGSPEDATGGSDPVEGRTDLSVVRQALIDFEPVSSPEALATGGRNGELHHAIVAGEIEGVSQRRGIFEAPPDIPAPQVLIKVRVTDEIRSASPDYTRGGYVYFELYQGPVYGDGASERIDTPVYTLEDWNEALPPGTPILLYLKESTEDTVGVAPEVPVGARIMSPDTQGVILEDGGKLLGGLVDIDPGWTDAASIDELIERLRAVM